MQLHNTLTRQSDGLRPIDASEVRIYSCGPTVYQTAHLGNFRTFIMSDTLRRSLEYLGYAVRHVMNITDVGHLVGDGDSGEDKIEQSAHKEHRSAWEIASYYTDRFWNDAERLHILRPTVVPKATDHIPEQIALIGELEAGGHTYTTSDGVYFDVATFPSYGVLTGQTLADKAGGERIEANDEKRQPADFALWKFSYPGGRDFDPMQDDAATRRQMEWASPWGLGYPGWHIECSAMSVKYLGQPFDIHTGGVDHIMPHHSNEIAQSEAAAGKPLANVWLHGEFMLVDGQKMSKSLGNTFTVDDVEQRGIRPLAFRLLALTTHYRKPLNFTWDALSGADQALGRLTLLVRNLPDPGDEPVPSDLEEQFRAALGNDLNMPQALSFLWDTLKSNQSDIDKAAAVKQWDTVFGLGLAASLGDTPEIPDDVVKLAAERDRYRKQGDYGQADAIRDELMAKGYEIQDAPQGAKVVPHTGATLL